MIKLLARGDHVLDLLLKLDDASKRLDTLCLEFVDDRDADLLPFAGDLLKALRLAQVKGLLGLFDPLRGQGLPAGRAYLLARPCLGLDALIIPAGEFPRFFPADPYADMDTDARRSA